MAPRMGTRPVTIGESDSVPIVSVVVPTHGRAELIAPLLDSLSVSAVNAGGLVQVLIVDSSDDGDARIISDDCARVGAEFIRGDVNVRKKRNLGVALSEAPVVLFVDSDVTAERGLIARHLEMYARQPLLGGVLGLTVFEGDLRPSWRIIALTKFVRIFDFAKMMPYAVWATCSNTSYRKAVLAEVGGFDESFPFRLGGDDVDLAFRVNDAGYLIGCEPDAVVYHSRKTWYPLSALVRRAARWGQMDYHLYQKHVARRSIDAPRVSSTFVVLAVAFIVCATLERSGYPLLLPLVWLALVVVGIPVANACGSRLAWNDVPARVVAFSIELVNEGSTLYAFLKHGKLKGLWSRLIAVPEQPVYEWADRVTDLWVQLAMLVGVLGLWAWAIR